MCAANPLSAWPRMCSRPAPHGTRTRVDESTGAIDSGSSPHERTASACVQPPWRAVMELPRATMVTCLPLRSLFRNGATRSGAPTETRLALRRAVGGTRRCWSSCSIVLLPCGILSAGASSCSVNATTCTVVSTSLVTAWWPRDPYVVPPSDLAHLEPQRVGRAAPQMQV